MKGTVISIVIVIILIGGALVLGNNKSEEIQAPAQAVIQSGPMSSDSQIVEIEAKGGYSPRLIQARADTPTTIKVTTKGTFDCSSTLSIPSIGYRANLPPSGVTEIEVPPQTAGTSLKGICQMGMYGFAINFN